MSSNFIIRRMKQNEVKLAVNWALQEGWNPGLNDAECFYQADPNGFFIGLFNDEPIVTGSAVVYDDHFAFCGLYIVKPEFRAQGYGIQLTQERLRYTGKRITGLDGVVSMTSKYEHLGYVPAHKQIRYVFNGSVNIKPDKHITDVKNIPLDLLLAFDRQYFPAPRTAFLKCWIKQPDSFALAYYQDDTLGGYGVIRKCHQGYKIGPLFCKSLTIAQTLFEGLCSKVKTGPIYLDIPASNTQAVRLVEHYNMTPVFEELRMYRNGMPTVDLHGVYGITTFELG